AGRMLGRPPRGEDRNAVVAEPHTMARSSRVAGCGPPDLITDGLIRIDGSTRTDSGYHIPDYPDGEPVGRSGSIIWQCDNSRPFLRRPGTGPGGASRADRPHPCYSQAPVG